MIRRADVFNPKRRIMPEAMVRDRAELLAGLAARVGYGGNPEHKRDPGDFGLTPPAFPRRGKSLCDDAGLFRRSDALALVRVGLRMGLVDARWDGQGWPQLVWAVLRDMPLEAQREAEGCYHGYPMPQKDPLREFVLERWRRA